MAKEITRDVVEVLETECMRFEAFLSLSVMFGWSLLV